MLKASNTPSFQQWQLLWLVLSPPILTAGHMLQDYMTFQCICPFSLYQIAHQNRYLIPYFWLDRYQTYRYHTDLLGYKQKKILSKYNHWGCHRLYFITHTSSTPVSHESSCAVWLKTCSACKHHERLGYRIAIGSLEKGYHAFLLVVALIDVSFKVRQLQFLPSKEKLIALPEGKGYIVWNWTETHCRWAFDFQATTSCIRSKCKLAEQMLLAVSQCLVSEKHSMSLPKMHGFNHIPAQLFRKICQCI